MGFVVVTEGALRPRAYFSPYGLTHSLWASHTIDYLLPVYMLDCVVLTFHAGIPVLTLGFCPLSGYLPNWF